MAAPKVSTQTGPWHDSDTWGGTGEPGGADDVFIASNHTVTIHGLSTKTINSLSVSGVLEHADNSTTEANKIILDIVNDCTVAAGGRIDVSALGYNAKQGPGYGGSGTRGGSYGGRGWSDHATLYGETYGSITAPTNCGSGGDSTAGGGAVILAVEGETKVYGYIKANSGSAGQWNYAGAGGSVFLTTSNLVGTGTIEARTVASHFSGGGGRIAVVLTGSDSFGSVNMITYASQDLGADGAAGTVYLEKESDDAGQGELVVNQNNYLGNGAWAVTAMSDKEAKSYQFSRFTATNSGVLVVGSDDSMNLTGATLKGETNVFAGIIVDGGTLTVDSSWTLTDLMVAIRSGSTFDVPAELTIGSDGILAIDSSHTISGDVTVEDGGKISHTANSTTEAYRMDLTIGGDLQVDAGGAVDVDDKGYATKKGPGYVTWGASHGGVGNGQGPTYGSIVSPTNCGSGGSTRAGGGAAILTVEGEARVYGFIKANATLGGQWNGAGAGGSVFLTTSNLVGTGTIQASATSTDSRYSGGGGRIAVHLTGAGSSFGSVGMTAYGGNGPGSDGAAGTVYRLAASQGQNEGTLIIDQPHNSAYYTSIDSLVTAASVGDVIIRNNGELKVETDQTLQVSGNWSNANDNVSAFTADAGGRVEFIGTGDATVFGSTTFQELVCTNVSKQINFEAGETTAVDEELIWTGPSDTSLVLRSTSPGDQWRFDVDPGITVLHVSYVNVKDSDATPGQDVTAVLSKDSGNNDGWVFGVAGETNWWTGGVSTNWADNGNWSLGRPPAWFDGGTIVSNDCAYYPTLPSDKTLGYFEMKDPSELSLGGYDLTVNDNAVIAGTVTATDTETLTFNGDVDFTSGTFTQAQSTVVLADTDAQSMTSDGASCHRLTVTNSGRTVSFSDKVSAAYFRNESVSLAFSNGVTAAEFRAYTTDGPITQQFAGLSTSTITDMFLLGSEGKTNWLVSSSSGTKWNLGVDRIAYVKHANVEDSDADPGVTIYPVDSVDTGPNNDNWVFTDNWLTWHGTVSSDFSASGNWTPATSPDASARVNIDGNGDNAPVLSSAASVLELLLGGDETSSLDLDDHSLTVGENLRVMGFGTLTANKPVTISNDLTVLDGGAITHAENTSTEAYKINMTVGGDFYFGSTAEIDVDYKGYDSGGPGTGNGRGGSYGGQGGAYNNGDANPTYGSVLAPTNCGSDGAYDGGGAVQFTVTGETWLYGYIHANGEYAGSYSSGGSGGSIFLTTSSLVGNGTLEAEGGGCDSAAAGGGGRIAVVLTTGTSFDEMTMKVRGGIGNRLSQAFNGANGTIYLQTGSQAAGAGTVIVDCDGLAPDSSGDDSATTLPPQTLYVPNELANATLVVTNDNTHMRIWTDLYVGDLLIYTNTRVTLTNMNLYVDKLEHHLDDATEKKAGGPTNAVDHYEQIIWTGLPPGSFLLLR